MLVNHIAAKRQRTARSPINSIDFYWCSLQTKTTWRQFINLQSTYPIDWAGYLLCEIIGCYITGRTSEHVRAYVYDCVSERAHASIYEENEERRRRRRMTKVEDEKWIYMYIIQINAMAKRNDDDIAWTSAQKLIRLQISSDIWWLKSKKWVSWSHWPNVCWCTKNGWKSDLYVCDEESQRCVSIWSTRLTVS